MHFHSQNLNDREVQGRIDDKPKCGHFDCPRCAPSKILPSHRRGDLKPNRRTTAKTKGYRVYPSSELSSWSGAETFATFDMAISTAKRKAKAERISYCITKDGWVWLMVKWDGSTEEVPI